MTDQEKVSAMRQKVLQYDREAIYDVVVIDDCTAGLIIDECIMDSPSVRASAIALQSYHPDLSIEQCEYIIERLTKEAEL